MTLKQSNIEFGRGYWRRGIAWCGDKRIVLFFCGSIFVTPIALAQTDYANVLLGNGAGKSITKGVANVFVGTGAGDMTTEGDSNVFIGLRAGERNLTGKLNTFVGAAAGEFNTAVNNTFIGATSGRYTSSGLGNTFTGFQSGLNNKSGDYNTNSGINAGYSNITGGRNTLSGVNAGYSNKNGSWNTIIGTNAGKEATTGSNNVFIGANAGYHETGSNQLYISNSATSRPLIKGDFSLAGVTVNGRFQVTQGTPTSLIISTGYGNDETINGGYFMGQRAQGTVDQPLPVQNDNALAVFGGQGYDGSNFTNSHGGMVVRAAGNWDTSHHGTYLTFNTTTTEAQHVDFAERMRITADGNIGIGTTSPQTKLAVNGRISAKSVEITMAGWPDFVFDADYQLLPLSKVEEHIQLRGRLPDVPSQKTVAKQGLDLGQMNALLMQKIEELTLHTIRQQKEIDALRKTVLARN